jgi:hypothetical protein
MQVEREAERTSAVLRTSTETTLTLQALHEVLGSFGFRWLAACAVYPALRLPITLHLGAALRRADGAPPPDEESLLELSALPWFRQGWMPDELRAALVAELSLADQEAVRTALLGLAFATLDAASDHRGQVTVARVPTPDAGFRRDWEAWRSGLPQVLGDHDRLFASVVTVETSWLGRSARTLLAGASLSVVVLGLTWLLQRYLDSSNNLVQLHLWPSTQAVELPLTLVMLVAVTGGILAGIGWALLTGMGQGLLRVFRAERRIRLLTSQIRELETRL